MDGVLTQSRAVFTRLQEEGFLSRLAEVSDHCLLVGLLHFQVDGEEAFPPDSLVRVSLGAHLHDAFAVVVGLRLPPSLQGRRQLVLGVDDL